MQKKLLSGLFWVLLLNLIVKPFWILGVEVGVQNAVGNEQYGLYISLFNLAYIFNILLDVGVTNFNTRNIAQHPQLIDRHLPGILSVKLLLLGFYLMVTLSVGLLLGYRSEEFLLLAVLSFNQFLNSLILYLRSNFEGLLLFKWDSVLSVMDRVVMILICGLLLWAPGTLGMGDFVFRIEYFVYAQTVAYAVTALLALLALWRKIGIKKLRFNKPFSLAILRQSLPFALLVLLMASYNRIDPVLLRQLSSDGMGNAQAGIYAGAFRLLDALTMIAYLVSVPLLPIYARLTKDFKKGISNREIEDTTRQMTSLVFVFSVAAALTFSLMSEELMDLLYVEHVEEYAAVFRVLIFGIIPICFTYVYGTLLTANGSLKHLNILAAITLVINVVVNLILIPRHGALGSAYASLSAQCFMALTQMFLAIRVFGMRPKRGYLIRLAVFVVIVMVSNFAMSHVGLWIHLLVEIAVSVLAAIALRLIDIKNIINQFTELNKSSIL